MSITERKAQTVREDWQDGQLSFDRAEVQSLLLEIDRLKAKAKGQERHP